MNLFVFSCQQKLINCVSELDAEASGRNFKYKLGGGDPEVTENGQIVVTHLFACFVFLNPVF